MDGAATGGGIGRKVRGFKGMRVEGIYLWGLSPGVATRRFGGYVQVTEPGPDSASAEVLGRGLRGGDT